MIIFIWKKTGDSIKYLNVKNDRNSNSKIEIFSETRNSIMSFKNVDSEWLINSKVDGNFEFLNEDGTLVYNVNSNNNISIGEIHNTSEKLFVKGNTKIDGSLETNLLKIPSIKEGQGLMSNADGQLVPTQFKGDINISSDGTTSIQSDKIKAAMITDEEISNIHIKPVIPNKSYKRYRY